LLDKLRLQSVTPISSNILKWLRIKVVSLRHDFQPCTATAWDCLIVGLFWLHHVQFSANVTMETIVIGKVSKLVILRTSCFYLMEGWSCAVPFPTILKGFSSEHYVSNKAEQ
jgi:hypothetical protein